MTMQSKRYRITAAREYESTGKTKTAWVNLGTLWLREDGSISGVLEVAPVGSWFDGRIHAFRADDDSKSERKPPADKPKDLDDDIPF